MTNKISFIVIDKGWDIVIDKGWDIVIDKSWDIVIDELGQGLGQYH